MFKISYRGKFSAEHTYVKASSLEKAIEVGQAWCASQSTERVIFKFMRAEPFVVADESILKTPVTVAG